MTNELLSVPISNPDLELGVTEKTQQELDFSFELLV